jgi:tetratricopeptide (TPR) repeat protein
MVWTLAALGLGVLVLLVLWQALGRGPRRRRAFRRAQKLLRTNDWRAALGLVHDMQGRGRLSAAWQDRLRRLEAVCHRAAADAFLGQKEYEKALEHVLRAARLLGEKDEEARAGVIGTMLTEARLLFAGSAGSDTGATHGLLARILLMQSPCPEASFWLALSQVRDGKPDLAEASLRALSDAEAAPATPNGKRALDPLLYLGALLLRKGEPREALRYLTEANRIDGNSPFVIAQLGTAMVKAGGDPAFASRALQRALGPRGFLLWKNAPQTAWVEGLPKSSYVRGLALQRPYICPLWGADLQPLLRQANMALGEGLYRQGNAQEAVDVFNRLLEEGAPSLPILRGLGLALARLERYDQAFKHLRAAHELDPDDRSVAAHLALCGARGKPLQPEDQANNIAWAIWLLGRYDGSPDAEWLGLASAVFAEARAHHVPIAVLDQVKLCDQLLSVRATDPMAAEAYHHVQATAPEAVKPEYDWLYCRAAQVHGMKSEHGLALFARSFQEEAAAQSFFAEQGWDWADVEYAYLALAAERAPGHFPQALGPAYPARGEELLLGRSARLEEAGQVDAALAGAEILVRLAPQSPRAHDCLARLYFRRGNLDQARTLLHGWARLEPSNHLPWLRLAVIAQQHGDLDGCSAAVNQALAMTKGMVRANVAFLGARLTLAWLLAVRADAADTNVSPPREKTALTLALGLLEECLKDEPGHADALWMAGAVRALLDDQEGLAAQAAAMNRPGITDARFHFMAGVCRLAAGDDAGVLEACGRAGNDPALAAESAYLMGWACIHRREPGTAALAFQRVAQGSPSAGHAQAILGAIRFHQGNFDEAVQCWQRLDECRRKTWGFDKALAGGMFLAGLKDLRERRFEQAAGRFREAGKLGHRDARLGSLLSLALLRAGQELLYRGEEHGPGHFEKAADLLEQALRTGSRDPQALYLLALACKRQGKTGEARTALGKIANPDAGIFLQLGVLALADGQYAQAVEEFSLACEMDPSSYEAAYNSLLARLALGELAACAALVPRLLPLAPTADEKRFLALLGALLQRTIPPGEALAPEPGDTQPLGANGPLQEAVLAGMPRAQEQRLLQLLVGLGQMEAVYPLSKGLAEARPHSPAVQEAHLQAVLVQARRLADRCQWTAAGQVLQPLARLYGEGAGNTTVSQDYQVALLNLLGVCDCLAQDFSGSVRHFNAALTLRPTTGDAWLHQNLALANELLERFDQADIHWNRYFDLVDARIPAPALANYHEALAFEGLTRLADLYTRKERWATALPYAQRAQRLRPKDVETLERLFHLYQQTRRPDDVRRTLRKLRELRPEDPQYELFELDVREVRGLDDIDRKLGDLRRVLSQHPGDMRVEERAVATVGNVIPNLGMLCDQHADRLARIVEQVRRLPSYQVNWPVVHDEMRRLGREFHRLRKLAQKCAPLVTHPEHRRVIKELTALIESKIQVCESLGG